MPHKVLKVSCRYLELFRSYGEYSGGGGGNIYPPAVRGLNPANLGGGVVTGSSLLGSALCEVVDDRPFPLSRTVYNTFVFGGRSVVSEHIGYYTDRKGNDIVLENNW